MDVEKYSNRYEKLSDFQEACYKSADYMEHLVQAFNLGCKLCVMNDTDQKFYAKGRRVLSDLINEMIHVMADREERMHHFLTIEKLKEQK